MAVNQPHDQHTTLSRVLTPREAARELRISRVTIYRLLADGTIRHSRLGAAIRIPRSEVERIQAGAIGGPDGEAES